MRFLLLIPGLACLFLGGVPKHKDRRQEHADISGEAPLAMTAMVMIEWHIYML